MSTDLRIAAILIPIDDLSLLSMTLDKQIAHHENSRTKAMIEGEEVDILYHKECAYSLGRILKKVDYLIKLHHAPTLDYLIKLHHAPTLES